MKTSAARPAPTFARQIFLALFGISLAAFIRLLGATWRYRVLGDDIYRSRNKKVFLGALWHHSILMAAHYFRGRSYLSIVSHSRDGDLTNSVVPHLGYLPPVRGSSSRGGVAALRELIENVRNGISSGIFCDGPRGPACELKTGILHLASVTQTAITPVAFDTNSCIRFKSWDRTILPLPFAKVSVAFGEPISIPPNLSKSELEAQRIAVEKILNELTKRIATEYSVAKP